MSLEERKYIGRQVGLHPDSGKRVIVPIGKCPDETYNVGRQVGVHPESGKRIFAVSDSLCDPDGNLVKGYRYIGRQVGVHPESGKRIFAVGCKNCESDDCNGCGSVAASWTCPIRWISSEAGFWVDDVNSYPFDPYVVYNTTDDVDEFMVGRIYWDEDCDVNTRSVSIASGGAKGLIGTANVTAASTGGEYVWTFSTLSQDSYDLYDNYWSISTIVDCADLICGYKRYLVQSKLTAGVLYCNKRNFFYPGGSINANGYITLSMVTTLQENTSGGSCSVSNGGISRIYTSQNVNVYYDWLYFNCDGPIYAIKKGYFAQDMGFPNSSWIPYGLGSLPNVLKILPA